MAKQEAAPKVGRIERFRQFGRVVAFVARRDRLFVPLAAAAILVPFIVITVLVVVAGISPIYFAVALLLAFLFVLIVLNSRFTKAQINELDGQVGAAAGIIEQMRGNWRVTPGLAMTTQEDMVTLVIGRPGVVLVGEGNPARLRGMLGQEKRRLAKVIGTTEMRDFIIGEDEGEVPLKKLRITLMRMPRSISDAEVNALSTRVKALQSRPQMPKGAIPKHLRPQGPQFRPPRGR
jgi:high-affinity K+ transport system ATPase subunit B